MQLPSDKKLSIMEKAEYVNAMMENSSYSFTSKRENAVGCKHFYGRSVVNSTPELALGPRLTCKGVPVRPL